MVPAEVLAGLTDALTAPVPQDVPDLWPVLADADWTYTRNDDGTAQAVSPDQLVQVERARLSHDGFVWRTDATEQPGGGPQIWHAWLHDTTPAHLLVGFVTALASPEPVQRGMHDLTGHYSVTQERSTITGDHIVEAHIGRLEAARARARAARRVQLATQSSPAPARSAAAPAAHTR
ncbi:DUF317 domain-containing protein [Streptomyces sp. NBC_01537]|uniref:DUF317 domain-containing protein n=1 Tax=Streptomyces sp. NBC_01537 TaxID=2903896 RepID=UPI00386BFBA9